MGGEDGAERGIAARRVTRTALVVFMTAFVLAALVLAACNGGVTTPVQPPAESPAEPQAEQQPAAPPPVQVIVLTVDDLGAHLEATALQAGLIEWLENMQDPVISALPARALGHDGSVFSPSATSPNGETFWWHVITDVSAESAEAWVRYLSEQSPAIALSFTSPDHDLFRAEAVAVPRLGSAAMSARLLHGHEGGRWRTEVIVFSQGAAIVFLRSSRREERDSLTELPRIAELISKRLAAPAAAADR